MRRGPPDRARNLKSRWVVHCKKEPYDVYIGRAVPRSGFNASVWGNPFKLGKDGTQEEIMAKYRAWLPAQPELMARLHTTRDFGDVRDENVMVLFAKT